MISDFRIEINLGKPKLKDYKILVDGMLKYHAQKGHPRKSEQINIFLKDKYKRVIGGAIATVLWNGIQINSLWIDESIRNNGLGTKLVKLIENEGKIRGCTFAYTDTFTWQAPAFYEKLGYKQYGILNDFPHGNSLTYFYKKI